MGPRGVVDTEVRGKISCLCWRSDLDLPVVEVIVPLNKFQLKKALFMGGKYITKILISTFIAISIMYSADI
jgi:hypothetical protein